MNYEGIFNTSNISKQISVPHIKDFSKIFIKKVSPQDDAEIQKLLDFDELAYFTQNDTPKDHEPPRYSFQEFKDIFNNGEVFEMYGELSTDKREKLLRFYIFERKGSQKEELYVGGLDIHPDYRNVGLGSFVLHIAEIVAKQTDGIQKLTLTVDPLNGRGLSAYLKFGFRIIAFEKNHFGPKSDRFIMIKNLVSITEPPIHESREVACGDEKGLIDVTKEGFRGVSLIRKEDNYKNKIKFIK